MISELSTKSKVQHKNHEKKFKFLKIKVMSYFWVRMELIDHKQKMKQIISSRYKLRF